MNEEPADISANQKRKIGLLRQTEISRTVLPKRYKTSFIVSIYGEGGKMVNFLFLSYNNSLSSRSFSLSFDLNLHYVNTDPTDNALNFYNVIKVKLSMETDDMED